MSDEIALASLAVEHWKLVQSFKSALPLLPEEAQERVQAQIRYSSERLEKILASSNTVCVAFDNQVFEINLPAVAINAEDASGLGPYLVERTIEPAIVRNGAVIRSGKVFLTQR